MTAAPEGPKADLGSEEVPPFNQDPYAHHWFEKKLGPLSPGAEDR